MAGMDENEVEAGGVDADLRAEWELMSSGSIAGLNGSGVYGQSAIRPPTRANMKAKTRNATNNRADKRKQTQSSQHNSEVSKRTHNQE
jgi:hypothetical protein